MKMSASIFKQRLFDPFMRRPYELQPQPNWFRLDLKKSDLTKQDEMDILAVLFARFDPLLAMSIDMDVRSITV